METQPRITGCQSTNHSECYGELWSCERCGKSVCYAEGTDNDPDVCDDCWVQIHYPAYAGEQPRRPTRQTAPAMQRVITQLLEQHGIDVNEADAFLWLALPGQAERLIIERIDERYLSVALAHPDGASYFTLAPDVFFATDATGWTPVYGDGVETGSDLTPFAEAWAARILAEGWLTQAEKLPEPPWQAAQDALWASVLGAEPKDSATGAGTEELCDDVPF